MNNPNKIHAHTDNMKMTTTMCEESILNICRSQYGTIREALRYAAKMAVLNNEFKERRKNVVEVHSMPNNPLKSLKSPI
jgi:hypothetical protein